MKPALLLLVAAVGYCLSGCTNLHPVPVKNPPAYVEATTDRMTLEKLNLKRSGLLAAVNFEELAENAEIYARQYGHVAAEFTSFEYSMGDIKLFLSIVGLGAGIAEEVDLAIAAAALAAGPDVLTQRFNLAVQATNYRRASEAFYCIADLLHAFPLEYPKDGRSFPFLAEVNRSITELRLALEREQLKVTLAEPDIAALKLRVEESVEALKDLEGSRAKFAAKLAEKNRLEGEVDGIDKSDTMNLAAAQNKLQAAAVEVAAAEQALREDLEDDLLARIRLCVEGF